MRRGHLLLMVLAVVSFTIAPRVYGQASTAEGTRKKAFDLFRQDKDLEALPLFEELALKNPEDRDVLLGLGVCLITEAGTLDDQEAAAKERVRARQLLLKAKKQLPRTNALLGNGLLIIERSCLNNQAHAQPQKHIAVLGVL